MDASLQQQCHTVNVLSPAEDIFPLTITPRDCGQAVQYRYEFILADSLKQL